MSGASKSQACKALSICQRTYQRWVGSPEKKEDGRLNPSHEPKNKLAVVERQKIIAITTSAEHCDLPVNQIVPKLADEDNYIASESTFYRVLKEENLSEHRGKSKPKTRKKPKKLVATRPNMVWSWDITYLPSLIKGNFYYLYLIMDIFSRKIVGYEVYNEESAENAAIVANNAYTQEQIEPGQVTLHSDNGSPMKGATMLCTLQKLGVEASFSRPSVSNDNPYSESLFKTLKYCPIYPSQPFNDLNDAKSWVDSFVQWYNNQHKHSAIKFVTPSERHNNLDKEILLKRERVYLAARKANPSRWSGNVRNWSYIEDVSLNPGKALKKAS